MKFPSLFKTTKVQSEKVPAQLTLEDVVAPSVIEVDFNSLLVDSHYFRTYFVSNYPRFVEINWLEPLISFDHSLLISMFIYPSQSAGVLDELKRKIGEMEATIQTDLERGRSIDPTVEVALEDAQALQEQLVKGVERFFQFSLYITVPAMSKEELHNTSKLVESTLASLSMTAQATSLQMEDGFISTLPLGADLLGLKHNMDTTSLATTFPFASSELTANEGIMYGINEHNDSLILFDRFSLENGNSCIFAKSGAGKSVSGNEPVLIQDDKGIRLVKIGQLVDQLIDQKGINFRDEELEGVANPNIQVLAFANNLKTHWSPVSIAARKTSPKDLYAFKTSSGRKITVTGDHNLVILRGGRVTVAKSTEIKEGDVVPIPRNIPQPSKPAHYLDTREVLRNHGHAYTQFTTGNGYRIGSHLRQIQTSLPRIIKTSDGFARLLGYITSEGWIGNSYTSISNVDEFVSSDVKYALTELGLHCFFIKHKTGLTCGINISSKTFTQFLHAIGANGKSAEKRVPGFLFNCTNEFVSSYLKAYFEGDGGVEKHQVSATTKSSQLASDLSYLLLRFGIIARIRTTHKQATNTAYPKKQDYYQLVISGQENLQKFSKLIGFVTDKKNLQLAKLLGKDSNTNVDTIPGIGNLLEEAFNVLYNSPYTGSPANLSPFRRGIFNPSPQTIKNLLSNIDQRINQILTTTEARISYLKKLPRLSMIIESGKIIPQVNNLLWQEMGASWRLAKNGLVTMGIGNALKATRVVFGETYDLEKIRSEIIQSFAELGLSLERFDPSLWNYLRYRKSDRGSYEGILRAIDYLDEQFKQKLNQIKDLQVNLEVIRTLANSDLFWDPIVQIEKRGAKEPYVYDLTVDDEVFLAGYGGMFVHNSYLVKLEALRSLMFGTEIIIIDPESEYLPLCQAVGGEYINFSASSPVKINPFDLSADLTAGESELGRKILSLTAFLKIVLGNLSAQEAAILDRALKLTYQQKGITDDPKTQHNLPPERIPLMEDLYKVLVGMEEGPAVELAARLERFIKGSLSGIFSSQSNIHLNNSFTAFSVRDLPDQLRPLAIHMILDFVWTRIRGKLKRRIMIVDEAWYLMRNPDSAEFLVDMAKRARKYYLGLTTITQDVEDFLGSERGKEIISNSSIQILLKQAPASIDLLADIFNLSEGEQRLLLSAGIGQGLFFAGNTHAAMRVVASPQEHQLITSNPKELLDRQGV